MGNNECEVEINSAADVSIVAKDLVPQANYTDRHVDIEGVTGKIMKAPIAKVLLQLGERKLWMEAAVLDNTNKDVLLGRDNNLQFELLAAAMDAERRERAEVSAVMIREMERKKEEEEAEKETRELMNLNYDFLEERPSRTEEAKARRRHEGLAAFKDSLRDLPEELAPTREQLIEEQHKDKTLTDAWKEASPGRPFRIIKEMLYHISTGEDEIELKQVVVPEGRRRAILSLAHSSTLASHMGRRKAPCKILRCFYWPTLNKDIRDWFDHLGMPKGKCSSEEHGPPQQHACFQNTF